MLEGGLESLGCTTQRPDRIQAFRRQLPLRDGGRRQQEAQDCHAHGAARQRLPQPREAAGRVQSQNNLEQIGIANHAYHDANNKMTPGVDDKQFSGLMYLLPYIEQDNLYKNVDRTTSPDDRGNATVRATKIPTYVSPLDEVAQPDP